MSTPAAQIVATGTPITTRLGTGAVVGNTVTFGGYTLGPNQPGWTLTSSTGGPGFVTGTWRSGAAGSVPEVLPAQGAFYRSGRTGAGSGGGDYEGEYAEVPMQTQSFRLSKGGWILLGLVATLLIKGK